MLPDELFSGLCVEEEDRLVLAVQQRKCEALYVVGRLSVAAGNAKLVFVKQHGRDGRRVLYGNAHARR